MARRSEKVEQKSKEAKGIIQNKDCFSRNIQRYSINGICCNMLYAY